VGGRALEPQAEATRGGRFDAAELQGAEVNLPGIRGDRVETEELVPQGRADRE
jgi:hypothetical protein